MTPSADIEPGPHWWKASALTTTPTCHLNKGFWDYSMLITWYKIGKVYVRLLGTNRLHLRAEIYCCRLTLPSEPQIHKISRRHLADYVKKKMHEKAYRTCSKIIFPHLTNQSIDCFTVVVSLTPCQAWFPYRCICRICRTKKIHRIGHNSNPITHFIIL